MSVSDVLGQNAAVVVLRISPFSGCSEEDIFELPIELYAEKHLGSFEYKDTKWEIGFDFDSVDNFREIFDFSVDLRLIKGEVKDICITLAFKFYGFDENNFLFVPSVHYGKVKEDDCFNCEDNHFITLEKGSNLRGKYISINECSTPSMGFFNQKKEEAFMIGFKKECLRGFEGIGFMEMTDKKLCEFLMCIPFRTSADENNSELIQKSIESMKSGKPLHLETRLVHLPCKDLGAFYNIYFEDISDLYKDNHLKNNVPLSYAAETLINKLKSTENKSSDILNKSIKTLIYILQNNEKKMLTAVANIDSLMSDIVLSDIDLSKEDENHKAKAYLYEIDKLEATFFISKALLYINKIDDRLIRNNWENDAGFFTSMLIEFTDKEIIPYIKNKIESSCSNNTLCSSISIIPASLTSLGLYLNNNKAISKSMELAQLLYKINFECNNYFNKLSDGLWSYMLLESFCTIYEATNDKDWLDKAVKAGSFFSTWHAKYNINVKADKKKAKQSSNAIKNKEHKISAFFGNYSGSALYRMYLYTEDIKYLDILKQTLRCWAEDSDSENSNGILSYYEVPGLFINSKEGLAVAIDSIDAKILDRQDGRLRVVVSNPASYEAKIGAVLDLDTDDIKADKCFIPKYKELYFNPGETKLISL